HVLQPTQRYPYITNPVNIDAESQPGWAVGSLKIVIDGSTVPIRQEGLYFMNNAHNSEIKGLAINGYRPGNDGFNGFAIVIRTDNNIIQGNYFGIGVDGGIAQPNSRGIQIMNASNNLIGGTTERQRNLISGNTSIGIAIFGNEEQPGVNSFDNK